eukprot:Blabericola_migrator_1__8120@NODE_418_length_8690_cov_78_447872_g330_i0_p1_GENE_NODE_418_length_8690_cov_78_447872_g330_i0NODE_418_length_8690_cov_78_447872_g330_i0_p1_ORF_typecomplete_len1920_score310_40Redoxin/PF08534_10/1_4e18Carb_anhydrase/PF00194_21/8_9e13_NODE_418_length_8690_cov_78_447872_g330_i027528511
MGSTSDPSSTPSSMARDVKSEISPSEDCRTPRNNPTDPPLIEAISTLNGTSVTDLTQPVPKPSSFKSKNWIKSLKPPIKQGDTLPKTRILLKGEGLNFRDFFQTRRGVLFGGPGAFVPTCSDRHLVGFRDQASEIKKAGIDFIGCIYANDPYVLKAWARLRKIQDQFTFISDAEGRLTAALGLLSPVRARGLGIRPRRFAMVIGRNSIVEWISLDDHCFAEDVLQFLGVSPSKKTDPLERGDIGHHERPASMTHHPSRDSDHAVNETTVPVPKSITSFDDPSLQKHNTVNPTIAGDDDGDSDQIEDASSAEEAVSSGALEESMPDDFSSQELLLGRWRCLLLEASVRVDNLMRIPLRTLTLGDGMLDDNTIGITYNIKPRQHTISYTSRSLRVSADAAQAFDGFGHLRFEGKTYLATEFQLVGPSPHHLGDKPSFRRPVELRIIHQFQNQHKESNKSESQLLVVAVTFSAPPLTASERDNVLAINPFIHQVLEIPTLTPSIYEVFQVGRRALLNEGFDLQNLFPPDATFIKYSGVLSALGERVIWVVMKEALSLSRQQLQGLERFLLPAPLTVEDPGDAYVTSFVYRFLPKLKNIRAASGDIIIEALRKKLFTMARIDQTLSPSVYDALAEVNERESISKWLYALKRFVAERQREMFDLRGLIDRALEAFPILDTEIADVIRGRQVEGEWATTYLNAFLTQEDSGRLLEFINKYVEEEHDDELDELCGYTPLFSQRNSINLESGKRTSMMSLDHSKTALGARNSHLALTKTAPPNFMGTSTKKFQFSSLPVAQKRTSITLSEAASMADTGSSGGPRASSGSRVNALRRSATAVSSYERADLTDSDSEPSSVLKSPTNKVVNSASPPAPALKSALKSATDVTTTVTSESKGGTPVSSSTPLKTDTKARKAIVLTESVITNVSRSSVDRTVRRSTSALSSTSEADEVKTSPVPSVLKESRAAITRDGSFKDSQILTPPRDLRSSGRESGSNTRATARETPSKESRVSATPPRTSSIEASATSQTSVNTPSSSSSSSAVSSSSNTSEEETSSEEEIVLIPKRVVGIKSPPSSTASEGTSASSSSEASVTSSSSSSDSEDNSSSSSAESSSAPSTSSSSSSSEQSESETSESTSTSESSSDDLSIPMPQRGNSREAYILSRAPPKSALKQAASTRPVKCTAPAPTGCLKAAPKAAARTAILLQRKPLKPAFKKPSNAPQAKVQKVPPSRLTLKVVRQGKVKNSSSSETPESTSDSASTASSTSSPDSLPKPVPVKKGVGTQTSKQIGAVQTSAMKTPHKPSFKRIVRVPLSTSTSATDSDTDERENVLLHKSSSVVSSSTSSNGLRRSSSLGSSMVSVVSSSSSSTESDEISSSSPYVQPRPKVGLTRKRVTTLSDRSPTTSSSGSSSSSVVTSRSRSIALSSASSIVSSSSLVDSTSSESTSTSASASSGTSSSLYSSSSLSSKIGSMPATKRLQKASAPPNKQRPKARGDNNFHKGRKGGGNDRNGSSGPENGGISRFLTEERVELVNFMLKQLKRSSSAESADDVTTANTAANCKATALTEEELEAAERKREAAKTRTRATSVIRFAAAPISKEDTEDWDQDARKTSREMRLRSRKPTGHPALGQHVAKMLMQMASEGGNTLDEDSDGGKFEPAALTAQPKKGALKKVGTSAASSVVPNLPAVSTDTDEDEDDDDDGKEEEEDEESTPPMPNASPVTLGASAFTSSLHCRQALPQKRKVKPAKPLDPRSVEVVPRPDPKRAGTPPQPTAPHTHTHPPKPCAGTRNRRALAAGKKSPTVPAAEGASRRQDPEPQEPEVKVKKVFKKRRKETPLEETEESMELLDTTPQSPPPRLELTNRETRNDVIAETVTSPLKSKAASPKKEQPTPIRYTPISFDMTDFDDQDAWVPLINLTSSHPLMV